MPLLAYLVYLSLVKIVLRKRRRSYTILTCLKQPRQHVEVDETGNPTGTAGDDVHDDQHCLGVLLVHAELHVALRAENMAFQRPISYVALEV